MNVKAGRTGIAAMVVGFCLMGSRAEAATELRRFEAFNADGSPTVSAVKTETADSCSQSFVNTQATALRCFAGNIIRDPCFVDPSDEDSALCVASPKARVGIRMLEIEQAEDGSRNTPSSRTPWAIELASGSMCTFVSGASNARGSRRLNYFCGDRSFLWGRPNRDQATWTILRSRSFTGRGWRRSRIAIAWR